MTSGARLAAQQIADLRAALVSGGLPDEPEAQVALIQELESLKSTACAVQAETAVALRRCAPLRRVGAGHPGPSAGPGRGR